MPNLLSLLQNVSSCLKKRALSSIWAYALLTLNAQNSIVGDGFGGRLWYKPCNVSAAPYGAFANCNGELYGWGVREKSTYLVSLDNNQRYFTPKPVHHLNNIRYHSAGYTMTTITDKDSGYIWESFFYSRPVGILDSVTFCDGGWILGAYIKKNGKAYISCNAKNQDLLNDFEYSERYVVNDSFISTVNNLNELVIQQFIVQDVKGINDAVRCAVGVHAAYFLTQTGDVYVIAKDNSTSIGIGNTLTALKATKIDRLKDIIDIKTTSWGTLALDKNGDVYVMGGFYYSIPTKEPLLSNIVAISGQCDGWIGLALKVNGDVFELDFKTFPITRKLPQTNVRDIIAGEWFYYLYYGSDSFTYHQANPAWALTSDIGSLRIGTDFKLALPCITDQKVQVFTICEGDSVQLRDSIFKTPGFYDVWYHDTPTSLRIFVKDTFHQRNHYEYCYSDTFKQSTKDTTIFKNEDGTCVIQFNSIKVHPTYHKFDTLISCEKPVYDYQGTPIFRDTQYTHRYATQFGCDSTISTYVKIYTKKEIPIVTSKCIGDDFTFLNKAYRVSGTYLDTLKNFVGCDSIIYHIQLYDTACGLTVYIPNVFSPNQKGPEINNTFQPYIENHQSFHMIILDRWGEKLYETLDISQGWNGNFLDKPCQDGVYVYHIAITSKTNETYTYSGTVHLIR